MIPSCTAASPTPGIASIAAIISSQIARVSSVMAGTGAAGVRSRLSGHITKARGGRGVLTARGSASARV